MKALRSPGEPTLISLHSDQKEIGKRIEESSRGCLNEYYFLLLTSVVRSILIETLSEAIY